MIGNCILHDEVEHILLLQLADLQQRLWVLLLILEFRREKSQTNNENFCLKVLVCNHESYGSIVLKISTAEYERFSSSN
jgi:hypothetical protein